jgi:hypothetical protein
MEKMEQIDVSEVEEVLWHTDLSEVDRTDGGIRGKWSGWSGWMCRRWVGWTELIRGIHQKDGTCLELLCLWCL